MEAVAIIAMVNALTGVVTQLLLQARRMGVNVDDLLAKYDAAHAAAMSYTPLPSGDVVPPPQS